VEDFLVKDDLSDIDLLLEKLWEISIDGMCVTDEHGSILVINDSFCKIFHMKKENLLGNSFSIVYARTEQESVLKTYRDDIFSNKLKTLFERENTLWNGEKVWFEFSNTFLTLPGKKITLSIIKDITARKKSEIEIRESEYKLSERFLIMSVMHFL
jgi:PAS domain S-box-containing protein